MGRKSLLPVLMMVFLGLTSTASAALVARWTFDNNPNDQVGGLNWALNGGATYSTDCREGSHSLQCDGVDDYASLAGSGLMADLFTDKTVMLWFKADSTGGTQVLYDEGGSTNGITIRLNNGTLEAAAQDNNVTVTTATPFSSANWSHVAITFGASTFKLYLGAAPVGSVATSFASIRSHTNNAGLGARNSQDAFDNTATGDYYGGLIDDVQIFDEALTQADIEEIMRGRPKAWNPSPADGATDVKTPLFGWTGGNGALWHDLYLGTSTDLGPAELVAPRLVAPLYWHVPPLIPGGTYYWRVDAVSDGGATVVKGDVWTFTYASIEAWRPAPADGMKYLDPNQTLTWKNGLNGVTHDVYFGTDEAAVNGGTPDTFKGNVFLASFPTGGLQSGTTYYWRIDEVSATGEKVKGHIWSFTTLPEIPVADPSLMVWWKLDENMGTRAIDWSGHGHHGDFYSAPQWVEGYDGAALNFDDVDDSVIYHFPDETWSAYTVTVWAKADVLGQANNSSICATYGTATTNGFQFSFDTANNYQYHAGVDQVIGPASLGWVHLAVTYDGTVATAYCNGVPVATFAPPTQDLTHNKFAIGVNRAEDNWFDGSIDDFRVYDRALTQEEIELVLRVDPLRAWQPDPVDASEADIRTATPLTWTKGDKASKHDVYLGIEAATAAAVDSSDTTGVYRGRVNTTSFTPASDLDWGQTYFWRVDEINTDGSVTAGKVWSFTVPDYLIIDNFEDYTDQQGEEIFSTWIDGFTNGLSGSTVGYLTAANRTFGETTIVHGGRQSMPFDYNNVNTPWYSEAEREFSPVENWTFGGADTLVVSFQGAPVDFLESAGTITLSAAGTDIWNTVDEFRYVFKRLTGDGSIVARVDSITNTNVWAKGGVMIRESLDPSARHAMVVVTPGSGVAFQRRLVNNDVSVGTTEAGITAPHWVKLTRTGNVLTAQHSDDGVTWGNVVNATNPTSDTVVMGGTIYIGLALTSHAANVACTAVFSEIKTTGNVTGAWQQAEIGVDHPANSAQGLYVGIEDSAGKAAFVTHPDPAASTISSWADWAIPLTSFAGVNSAKVKKMYLGVGDRENPVPDGAGRIYIDDIRVTKGIPQPTP
jgi:regulation of enolase protein 1 (concanavalin A-like superfamily)